MKSGLIGSMARAAKGVFSSELEKMTLQLTAPTDSHLPIEVLSELVNLLNVEVDDPECVTSVIGKLSKKLHENNVFSKLKALASVHKLIQKTEDNVKAVVQELVAVMDEASQIIGFFDKWDEQKRLKVKIKRAIIAKFDEDIIKPVTARFMELARVKFK